MFVSPRFRDLLASDPIRTRRRERSAALLDFAGERAAAVRAKPEFIPALVHQPEFIPAPVFKAEFIPAPVCEPEFIPAAEPSAKAQLRTQD